MCPPPPDIPHGYPETPGEKTPCGAFVRYQCGLWWELEGNGELECSEQGRYSGKTPRCALKSKCPKPSTTVEICMGVCISSKK